MSVFNIDEATQFVYVILGIDAHQHDQVLAVRYSFNDAKKFMLKMTAETEYFDLWIEKHLVI